MSQEGAGSRRIARFLPAGLAVLCVVLAGAVAIALLERSVPTGTDASVQLVPVDELETSPGAAIGQDVALLRVAVAPVVSPEVTLEHYEKLVEQMGREVGRRGVLLVRDTYSEIDTLLRNHQCDVAFVCTYAYVRGARDYGLQLLAVPRIDGRTTYNSYLIVGASRRAETLLDLQGARFAGTDVLSNTGWLYPSHWLRSRGHNPEKFFSELVFTGGHDRSVQAVASGFVDGAAVDSLVYDRMAIEDPTLESRVRVLAVSPDFGMPPVVVHPALDAAVRARILEGLLRMHVTQRGREALAALGAERFVRTSPEEYDSVRDMMELLQRSSR